MLLIYKQVLTHLPQNRLEKVSRLRPTDVAKQNMRIHVLDSINILNIYFKCDETHDYVCILLTHSKRCKQTYERTEKNTSSETVYQHRARINGSCWPF